MNWRDIPHDRVVEVCASTNDLARELAKAGAPNGTWISARRQTAGRGRMNRQWHSEGGNLYFSEIFRAEGMGRAGWIPLLLGLAALRAIEGCLSEPAPLFLKWPNDLLIGSENPKKLGGILCEASVNGHSLELVAGIGINCSPPPPDLAGIAGYLSIPVDQLREGVRVRWTEAMRQPIQPAALKKEYEARHFLRAGSEIAFSSPNSPLRKVARVLGLSDDGGLLVRTSEGSRTLYSDDVSLR